MRIIPDFNYFRCVTLFFSTPQSRSCARREFRISRGIAERRNSGKN